jgi:hypothetical protein
MAGPLPLGLDGDHAGDAGSLCMLYVDNSRGMAMEGPGGPLLEHAKSSARRLIQSSKPDTRFVLMSNQSRPLHGGWLNKDRTMDLLDQIRVSNQSRTVSSVAMQMDRRLEQEGLRSGNGVSLWLFSDFHRGSMTGGYWAERLRYLPEGHAALPLNLVPCRPSIAFNAVIDSAWLMEPFLRSASRNRMVVRTRTYGKWPDGLNIPMELRMSGKRKALATLQGTFSGDAAPALRLDTLDFAVGKDASGLVELQIDEPYCTYDNRYYFSNPVQDKVSVLHMAGVGHNSFLGSVWATDTLFDVHRAALKDWSRLSMDSFTLAVVELSEPLQAGHWAALSSWIRDGGGHLLLMPVDEQSGEAMSQSARVLGSGLNPGPWRSGQVRTAHPEMGSEFLGNVMLRKSDAGAMPSVQGYFPMSIQPGDEILLKLESGDPLLKRFSYGQGMVYAMAVPAQERYTEWVRHDLFLPVLYRAALGSVRSGMLTGSLGANDSWSVPIGATDDGSVDWQLQARPLEGQSSTDATQNESAGSAATDADMASDIIRPEVRIVNGRAWIRLNNAEVRPGFYGLIRQEGEEPNTFLAINADSGESDIVPMSDAELLAVNPAIRVMSGNRTALHRGLYAGFFAGDGLRRLFLVACLVFLALEAVLLWQRKA